MSSATFMNQVIEADAHLIETKGVWDYLDGSDRKYRPILVTAPDNPRRQIWMLEG